MRVFAHRRGRLLAGDPRPPHQAAPPDDTISPVNAAIPGHPATMLQRVTAQTPQRHAPSRVALFAGTHDTPRDGSGASKAPVTGTETARNLTGIRSQAAEEDSRSEGPVVPGR